MYATGKFICGKSTRDEDWVYDVTIWDGDKQVALVGFNKNQRKGALYWTEKEDDKTEAQKSELWKYQDSIKDEVFQLAKNCLQRNNIIW